MSDTVSSCGGQVILIRNQKNKKSCVISWRSKKLRRVVNSTLAGEALAVTDLLGEIMYIKAILSEIFGKDIINIPIKIYTDSKNLYKAVMSTTLIEDRRLRTELAILKEAIGKKEINELSWIPGHQMLANCLTKRGASAESLL